MRIFGHVTVHDLDRLGWQLWILAVTMILILAGGAALLMYPAVFTQPFGVSGLVMRRSFFGFCVLNVLFAGYLVDRQRVVNRLRKQLSEERKRNSELRIQASTDLLQSLSGLTHFRDRLAMEFRRAVSSAQPLSLLAIRLKGSTGLSDDGEISIAFGDAAKAMLSKVRGEDSLYQFGGGAFGLLLPGVAAADAQRVAKRVAEGLSDAAGASKRYTFDIQVVNYPEHAESAREIEQLAGIAWPDVLPEQLLIRKQA